MKKILYSIIIIISISLFGLFFTTNNTYAALKVNTNRIGHVHEYTKLLLHIEPSCTMNGLNLYKCTKCILINTETLNKKEHNYKIVEQMKATCTKEGYEEYKCTNCNKTEKTTYAKLEHNFKRIKQILPTCTENGSKIYKCKMCNMTKAETIYKSGHNYKTIVIEPTCTKEGKKVEICIKCNATKDGSTVRTKALDHNYIELNEEKATCSTIGTKEYKCSRCGDTLYKETEKLDHAYKKIDEIKASCTSSGREIYQCTMCDNKTEKIISKTDHEYEVLIIEPTCTEDGKEEQKCIYCNQLNGISKTIKATGHDYKWETIPATCEKEGTKTGICSNCKEIKTEKISVNHEYSKKIKYEKIPEDALKHYEIKKCTICEFEIKEFSQHDFNSITQKCVCGFKLTEKEENVEEEITDKKEETTNETDKHIHVLSSVKYVENTNDVSTHYEIRKCTECGNEVKETKQHVFESNKCVCGLKSGTQRIITINRSKTEAYEGEKVLLSIGVVGDTNEVTIQDVIWSAEGNAIIKKNGTNSATVTLPTLKNESALIRIAAKIYIKIGKTETSLTRSTVITVHKSKLNSSLSVNGKEINLPIGTSVDVGVSGLELISGNSIKVNGTTIKAIKIGTARIKDKQGTVYTVVVTEGIIPIKRISIGNINISVGQTKKLTIILEPSNATSDYRITSSNSNILKCNPDGSITALNQGYVTITVKSVINPNISAQLSVKVNSLPTDKVERMTYTTIEGKNKNTSLLIGGNGEMRSPEVTISSFKPVIDNTDRNVIIATTTAKDDERNAGKTWIAGNNVSNTYEKIKEEKIDKVEAFSSGSILAIAATERAIRDDNNSIKELTLYDGFFGMQRQRNEFNRILENGTKVTLYWTRDAYKYYTDTFTEKDLADLEEKYPNFNAIEMGRDSVHVTVIKDVQDLI